MTRDTLASGVAAWRDLIAELNAHNEWCGDRPGTSGYVGVTDRGDYFGGAHVGGERLSADDWGEDTLEAEGDTPEATIADLIARLRQYRADRDRERAEREAEDAEYAAEKAARMTTPVTPEGGEL